MAVPFNYTSEYQRKLRTPEQAAAVVKSGDWIDISMGAGFPQLMDAAIAKRKEELFDVKIRGYLIMSPIQMVECDPTREHFIYNSWHMSGYERKLCDKGLCNFIPMVFRNLGFYYEHFLTVNVAMISVTPMNEHGYFNFSLSNTASRATLDKADVVIVEVNENLPWVYGGLDECIHIDDVDMIVEGEHGPIINIGAPAATEAEEKIAEYVVQNMCDGSTLQLGIGGLPNAVGQMIAKSDLRDLGIHTEMLCDSYLDMYKAGKITNRMKNIDRYKSVFGLALGSQDLYDWVRENPGVVTYPIGYCNNPATVGKIDNFVSVNNCISVDLYGQICAETSGTRQISGTGGQLDFLDGAAVSRGGKAFICLTSAFKDKEGNMRSRINPTLQLGDVVTDPRSQAYYIVTEYGGVNLMGCSTWQRAEKLISVAHPMFRDELIANAEKQGLWIRSNKR
ncbi:MAG: butyryl-CoA:acetate CoA-transferase [Clostridiales bacterium]|nr:butyryl-CoA:acetate CoA-transferase [Candidatus Cacconaster stercorequi]